jgi:hypothetical protein
MGMTRYVAFVLTPQGQIIETVDLKCASDEDAQEQAQQWVNGHAVELWDGAKGSARSRVASQNFELRHVSRRHAAPVRAVMVTVSPDTVERVEVSSTVLACSAMVKRWRDAVRCRSPVRAGPSTNLAPCPWPP